MSVAEDRTTLDELCVNTIRTLSMDAVQKANSGHPGTPMALAPLAYVLYTRVMEHSPKNPQWADRDRFVLSCGHASMLLYSTLYLTGYGLTLDDLKNFRQLGSPTAGHPEYGHAAGIETTTGPLGQGISTAVGMALAERMLAERYNREGHEIVDHYTYVIASDGDLQEGISSEASSLAGHLGLGRLISFWDDNHISIEGDTAISFTEDVAARYEAYGWHVQNLGEDIGLDRIEEALANAREVVDRPSLIVVRTHIAPGFAEQAGHPRRPRRAARRRGDQAHQGGLQLPLPGAVLRRRRGARPLPRVRAARRGAGVRLEREVRALPRGVPGAGRAVRAPALAQAARGLGRRRAHQGPGRRHDRHPQGVAGHHPVGRREGAGDGRRQRRPRALDADADQRRRVGQHERLRGPQLPLRHPRARHGRDHQRPRAEWLPRVRRRLLHLQRLHEGVDPARRDHAHPEHLRVHPRLDRRRRGRPDPPADRAARRPARHPEHQRRPPGGLQRDRPRLALRA